MPVLDLPPMLDHLALSNVTRERHQLTQYE